jgi:plastocyanin
MFPVRLKQIFSAAAILALAGCGSQSMTAAPPADPASHGVAPLPAQIAQIAVNNDDDTVTIKHVGVRLNGEQSFNSPTYGLVLGYFNGKTSHKSEIVKLTAATTVVFNNVDTVHPHTASFLGDASANGANWPPSFDGSSQPAPAGTAIGTTNFSTGPMSPGTKSKKYSSGSPGFYMFGCAFHYNSNGMRTVIIVM